MSPSPVPTVDLTPGATADRVCLEYEAAWREALVSGGPEPNRTAYLADAGSDPEQLAALLNPIEGAYRRLRELIRSGAATLARQSIASKPQFGPAPPVPGHSQLADTLEAITPDKNLESKAGRLSFPETLDSAPQTDEEQPPRASATLPPGAVVGGYQLLGVIARGGMGVVYKARHLRLDRLAAIKMVLGGAHASTVQLARFRAEAEVVARLQHPNIVQLFEVGEHDDLPYIALEFVEGGSLAHIAGGRPQPQREAAATIELLARAMDYAHNHGVVHRDLKPANVLVTSDGAPKVTDFGLAKRLEEESGQTRSGTLLGTPSYMAPEQAAGLVHAVGPRTDVYAMGAVLYELLTGVPPFTGSNPVETVVAVMETDPVPPRRLQPGLSRDLETICLKCLEKEPAKRYASAAELTDDLRRFLAGEIIRARPVGRAERLWRWCRRNPGIAALSLAVLILLSTVAGVATTAVVRINAEKWTAEQNAAAARQAQSLAESALGQAETARSATEAALKQTEAARVEAENARKRADELVTVAASQRELALDALGGLILQVQNRLDDAPGSQQVKQDLLELALAGLKKLAPAAEESGLVDIRMAEGYRRLGDLAQRLGDLGLARQSYEQVNRITKNQAQSQPRDPQWMRAVSVAETKLGDLASLTGNRAEAKRFYDEARKLRVKLMDLGGPNSAADLAQVYVKLGDVSDPSTAVDFYKDSLRLREDVLKGKPRDGNAARDVRVSNYKLADIYLKTDDVAAARKHGQRAVVLAEALVKANPRLAQMRQDLAFARAKLGDVFRAEKRQAEAKKQYDEAVRLLEPLARTNPRDLTLQVTYALFLAHAGRHVDAARLADRVRNLAPKNPFLLYNAACTYAVAAEAAQESEVEQTPKHVKLVAAYQEAALSSLKAALDAGFADHDLIRADPELAELRKLRGFAEVARGLRDPTGR
jgi:serine/threonine-protein kinase